MILCLDLPQEMKTLKPLQSGDQVLNPAVLRISFGCSLHTALSLVMESNGEINATQTHTQALTHTRLDRHRHRGRRVARGQGADKSAAPPLPVIG